MKKRWKQYIIAALLVLAVCFGISKMKFQTVEEYQKEGKQIASEINATESEGPVSTASTNEKATEKPTERPKVKKEAPTASPKKVDKQEKTVKSTSKSTATKKKKSTKKVLSTALPTASPHKEETVNDSNKEAPVTPTEVPKEKVKCTLTISCTVLSQKKDKLSVALAKYVPDNGILCAKKTVSVEKGSTVYEVLASVCQSEGIAVDAVYTPAFKTYYVTGIGQLYEKADGDMSGWLYKVNGKKPNIGASSFVVNENDDIVWSYTCNGRG